ncbi:hypothetical protein MKW98_021449 [Papaver atlanticum]|uniref:Uncharacterized protein n=1 Tax=Papaver atlanticum TaxID=357466 RepID=A0AAD4SSG8_9MAGN|nr:hypothetical protein MKW98_021449 [Papaver atlanticum]
MTDHEKQALKERCRAAYQNRKARVNAADVQHKAESSYVPRRSPRIELQQRELQLEKLRMTKRDRRSSLTENQKEEVLEKRRRAYEIRRARAAEASRKRKGKSVVIWEKRRRNNDIPGRKAGAIVIRSTRENNRHCSRDYSSSEDGEQELVDSGVPHQSGKENINIQVGPISGNHGTGKETTTPTATSIETGKALSKDSSGGDFRKGLGRKPRVKLCVVVFPSNTSFRV